MLCTCVLCVKRARRVVMAGTVPSNANVLAVSVTQRQVSVSVRLVDLDQTAVKVIQCSLSSFFVDLT